MKFKYIFIVVILSIFSFNQKTKNLENFIKNKTNFKVSIKNNPNFFKIQDKLYNNSKYYFLKSKKTHSDKNSYNLKVYTRIEVSEYDFENENDSQKTKENILNCFPFSCVKISDKTSKSLKLTPSIWLFKDNKIIIASTNCEHVGKEWNIFKKDLIKEFADEKDIIVTECGKLKWTTKQEILNLK